MKNHHHTSFLRRNFIILGVGVFLSISLTFATTSSFVEDRITFIMSIIEANEKQFHLSGDDRIEYYVTLKSIYQGVIGHLDRKLQNLGAIIPNPPVPPPVNPPPGGVSPSPNLTSIPSTKEIIDSSLSKWTVSGGVVYRNGSLAGYSANVVKLLYKDNKIYQQNQAGGWWYWGGTTWVDTTNPEGSTNPPTNPPVNPPPQTATYAWSTDAWGICSTSCGGGNQSRTVTCKKNDGTVAADSNCAGTKPATSQPCNTQACTPTNPVNPGHPTHPTGNMTYIDKSIPLPIGDGGQNIDNLKYTGQLGDKMSNGGSWASNCAYSHMNYDDAIVFPGQPGKAHLHTYFGNTSSDAFLTAENITSRGNSTCRGGTINRSSYWVPSMIDTRDGRPIAPLFALTYYRNFNNDKIVPAPVGLRIVAGNAKSTVPQTDGNVRFRCLGTDAQWNYTITPCYSGDELWTETTFPSCWDGKNLDSSDHQSHMAYPSGGDTFVCPSTHPIKIPMVTILVRYDITDRDSSTWRLSSDQNGSPPGSSGHADWFNGWKPEFHAISVERCINEGRHCHAHLLGDGRQLEGGKY